MLEKNALAMLKGNFRGSGRHEADPGPNEAFPHKNIGNNTKLK